MERTQRVALGVDDEPTLHDDVCQHIDRGKEKMYQGVPPEQLSCAFVALEASRSLLRTQVQENYEGNQDT